ncbi:hypothetical protein GPECTOR_56g361 [Gonium pectorale]|uniref:tRNA (guanine(26)-N(2))-dimethyltransferase n=1 Tax=Gonium pectorale TaxID=33097 RepID=A0A150G6V2_GONPE|nr:hypothetical protein GPECTOR_56g361 [Gonium pectorale]|eukprot:KXZ45265.1 hypothetical protein GPECTOR_56g361 [Gonium pectorale]
MADNATRDGTAAAAGTDPIAIPEGYKVLQEGRAKILQKGNDVFYNEAQVTNRDLSVAALKLFLRRREAERANRGAGGAGKGGGKKGKKEKGAPQQQQQQQQQQEQAKEEELQQGEGAPGAEEAAGAAAAAAAASQDTDAGPQGAADSGAAAPGGPSAPRATSGSRQPARPRLLEGLAATGLRSIRYALEVSELGSIDANDLDPGAAVAMRRNIDLNGGAAAAKIRPVCADARMTMLQNPGAYDIVDLDPYGTPGFLLDSAVQAVADGGLLMVTATDMSNLCGNNSTACFANYGSYPVHRPYCHEMALRIVLACIETHAARYKRHVEPLLCLSIDFYVRLFLRVRVSPAAVKDTSTRLAHLWQSSGCDSFWLQPVGQKRVQNGSNKHLPGNGPPMESVRCPETGSGYLMGGPIWSGPLHDQAFVQELLTEFDEGGTARYAQAVKVRGYLLSAAAELPDVPLYYNLHDIMQRVRATPPKTDVFRSALVHAGYRVSGSHACPLAIKTDAPPSVVWDVVRCWVRKNGVSAAAVRDPESYSAKLLAKEPSIEANFALVSSAITRRKEDKAPRFVQNPAYWGPKSRHGRPDQTRPQQQEGDAAAAGAAAAAPARGQKGKGRGKGKGGGGEQSGAAPPAEKGDAEMEAADAAGEGEGAEGRKRGAEGETTAAAAGEGKPRGRQEGGKGGGR